MFRSRVWCSRRGLAIEATAGAAFGLCLLALFASASRLISCPFCSTAGQYSLRERLKDADVAFIAELSDAKPLTSAKPGEPDGQTKARILHVLKSHPAVEGKKEIVLPRYIPAAANEKVTYLLYAVVSDGAVDPYLPELVDASELTTYLVGAAEQQNKPPAERLGYFFRHLGDSHLTIAQDAYMEFAAAPYKEVKEAAEHYDPDRLIEWIKDPSTQPYRIGLYGCLLGLCGRETDKDVLLEILDDPEKRPISGVDGLLGGLCVLDPEGGIDYVLRVLTDPQSDFNYRYAALRTVRVLVTDIAPDQSDRLWKGMAPAIHIKDISDLVIDEYRKNKVWANTDAILPLFDDKKFDVQVVKRSVVRYALKCPDPAAEAFVARLRKENPQLVADVEEILRFEEAQQVRLKAASG